MCDTMGEERSQELPWHRMEMKTDNCINCMKHCTMEQSVPSLAEGELW